MDPCTRISTNPSKVFAPQPKPTCASFNDDDCDDVTAFPSKPQSHIPNQEEQPSVVVVDALEMVILENLTESDNVSSIPLPSTETLPMDPATNTNGEDTTQSPTCTETTIDLTKTVDSIVETQKPSGPRIKNVVYLNNSQSEKYQSPLQEALAKTRTAKLISPISKKRAICNYQYKKGPKKGSQCDNTCSKSGDNRCSQHKAQSSVTTDNINKRSKLDHLEEQLALLTAKVKNLESTVKELKTIPCEKSLAVSEMKCTKLSNLTNQTKYKVTKVETNFACVVDKNGQLWKFKIPHQMRTSETGKYLRYNNETKKHSWSAKKYIE